jgi:hypothetical protein
MCIAGLCRATQLADATGMALCLNFLAQPVRPCLRAVLSKFDSAQSLSVQAHGFKALRILSVAGYTIQGRFDSVYGLIAVRMCVLSTHVFTKKTGKIRSCTRRNQSWYDKRACSVSATESCDLLVAANRQKKRRPQRSSTEVCVFPPLLVRIVIGMESLSP